VDKPPHHAKELQHMTTKKQIESNRRNAQNSTGPRTDEGRRRSSRNALKHGLSAQAVTLDDDEAAEFEWFRDDIIEDLDPKGPIEEQLVDRIAICSWRLRRVYPMEIALTESLIEEAQRPCRDSILEELITPEPLSEGQLVERLLNRCFPILTRYEIGIERSLQRAMHDLERWQARRKGQATVPPIAVDVTHDVARASEVAVYQDTLAQQHTSNRQVSPAVRLRTRPRRVG
jgi:hypothetical protein